MTPWLHGYIDTFRLRFLDVYFHIRAGEKTLTTYTLYYDSVFSVSRHKKRAQDSRFGDSARQRNEIPNIAVGCVDHAQALHFTLPFLKVLIHFIIEPVQRLFF